MPAAATPPDQARWLAFALTEACRQLSGLRLAVMDHAVQPHRRMQLFLRFAISLVCKCPQKTLDRRSRILQRLSSIDDN